MTDDRLDPSVRPEARPSGSRGSWTFLTNHGHVLICIANDPGIRGRDIAERVGITERAAQAIVADLVAAGYVRRTRVGRRNRYEIDPDRPLRHPVEHDHRIGELLSALAAGLPGAPLPPVAEHSEALGSPDDREEHRAGPSG